MNSDVVTTDEVIESGTVEEVDVEETMTVQEGTDEVTESKTPAAEGEDTPSEPEQKPAQTREENARFAAARRRREEQERIDAAVSAAIERERNKNSSTEQARAILGNLYGKVSPYDNKPILTVEDKQRYEQGYAAEQAKINLSKNGISEADIQAIVSNMPEVVEARRNAEESKKVADKLHNTEIQKLIEADIAEIGKYDPSIKTVDDLLDAPYGDEVKRNVDSGRMTYLQAFKLATFDKIHTARNNASANAATAQAASKSHLASTSTRGQGGSAINIPEETKEMYKSIGMKEADMMKHYSAYLKSKRKDE